MKIINTFVILTSLLFGQAYAATVSFEPAPSSVPLDNIFTLDIIGTDFLSSADGGGVNISFDNTILNVLSVSIDEAVWDFGLTGISTGTIDNSLGLVNGIMVNAFSDVGTSFIVASIEFQAVGFGTSDLLLSEFALNPWGSGGTAIDPAFEASAVTISETVVPVPAAAWLFGSGLLALLGISKRKNRT